jgi:hypothetical protein
MPQRRAAFLGSWVLRCCVIDCSSLHETWTTLQLSTGECDFCIPATQSNIEDGEVGEGLGS